ncbi:serine hydrolase domain-containing protein [Streptomyces flavofungini]|uniref:Beta-lactamase family protein n=1 Tax=Streptomyces flavofungini TaxID=68200 RepID=A0ABS0WZK3_9ACTN|nr:serine hydrolase domain-containing protein [Streptomyces flavofungini]MBJ3806284.1 beta-lactamase family protein [Streptomyces flavofungini]GHC46160.1 serine hydrolase [Streptomyces flavofungini]
MREQARQNVQSSGRRSGRRGVVTAAIGVALGALTVGALAPSAATAATGPDPVQEGLNKLVRDDGMPAALASVKDRAGHTRTYTAGVGDVATGAQVPRDGQVRVGSNTKAFTAVVVLQLVAEGKLRLDDPVDKHLPGLVRGDGIDGGAIKVRHLLQQTSGLPNYTEYDLPLKHYKPKDLVDIALKHKANFAPGDKWQYSNTNYVLAGMIIEKVTKHTYAQELQRRVIKRIGLRHTYFPTPRDATIREAHPKGYLQEKPGAPLQDVTEMDPSWTWSAGQLVSTNSDLNRFYSQLLGGHLLKQPQLDQMRTTVGGADKTFGPGARYGLGLVSRPLPCRPGELYWGHGGSFPGYETRGGATDDGRAANVAVTIQPTDKNAMAHVDKVVEKALCR